MKKFTIIVSMVFALGIWAEWVILSNPTTGVVLYLEHQKNSDDFKLHTLTSEGMRMEICMPSKVWREWLEPRKPREE